MGSEGTLGICTELTVRIVRLAEDVKTLLESFLLPEAMELLDPQALATVAASLGLAGCSGYG